MAKEKRTVKVYTEKALERAAQMSKETYHSIKHMSKIELVHYLDQLCATAYQQGYEAAKKELEAVPAQQEVTPDGIPAAE